MLFNKASLIFSCDFAYASWWGLVVYISHWRTQKDLRAFNSWGDKLLGAGSRKYKWKGIRAVWFGRRSGTWNGVFFFKVLFALIHSFTKFVPIMYWAMCKEGVAVVVNKATMAELSVLITRTLPTLSLVHWGQESTLSYLTHLQTQQISQHFQTLMNVKSMLTDLAFITLLLAMLGELSMAAFRVEVIVWDAQ